MRPNRICLALLFTIAAAGCTNRDKPPSEDMPMATPPPSPSVEIAGVVLYQPDAELGPRVSSMEELASYINKSKAILLETFKETRTPEAFDLVFIVKPGRRARIWPVSSLPNPPDRSALVGTIEALAVPEVKGGPVAFAISVNIAGARRQAPATGFSPPMPEEWRKAAQESAQPLSVPDGIVDKVWKD